MMKVVISAGNDGKNLRPLTCTTPVAALSVFGRPLIFYLLDAVVSLEPEKVILLLGYKAFDIISLFPDNMYCGTEIEYIVEDAPSFNAEDFCAINTGGDTTFLFIDADCFFDFDLSEALSAHKKSGADLTCVFVRVESADTDSDNNGIIFSDYGELSHDRRFRQTPVFFTDAESLCAILNAEGFDFDSQNFPSELLLNAKGAVLNGFYREITDTDSYRSLLFDILNGGSSLKFTEVAEGIFCEENIPSGSFLADAPVWIGKNVQISDGAVIGPCAVISDGCLIADGSRIRDSVLLDNVYISSSCTVNGALLCEGASLKKSSSAFTGSVAGADSITGEGAVLTDGVLIWPNKTVPEGAVVTENIKYGNESERDFTVSGVISGDFGVEITPEKSAKFGAAVGSLFGDIRVGVGIDGSVNALSLKCAFLGGLISTGAHTFDFGNCFESQMFYYSAFCDLDITVFISGSAQGVSVSLFERGGIALSQSCAAELSHILKRGEFNRCVSSDCSTVNVMNSMGQMYLSGLVSQFKHSQCNSSLDFFSSNERISACLADAFKRIGADIRGDEMIAKINDRGTRLTLFDNGNAFTHEKLLAVCAYHELCCGNDIALPWEAPLIITRLAEKKGRKVYRCYDGATPAEHAKLSVLGTNQLWSRDALFLLFKLLDITAGSPSAIGELVSELPEFYIAKKVINTDISIARLAEKLNENGFQNGVNDADGFVKNGVSARVSGPSRTHTLKIIAEAVSAEAARDICTEIEELINNVGIDNIGN